MRVKQAMGTPILQRRCDSDLHAPNLQKHSPNFHRNALQAMIVAINESRHNDSNYVKMLAYEFYEEDLQKEGEFIWQNVDAKSQ